MDDVDAVRRAITSRRAVRAFLPDPVPHEVVVDVLAAAARAPSGTNIQPWRVTVVTGGARDRLVDVVQAAYDEGRTEGLGDYYPVEFVEPYLGRRRKVGWDLYGLLGIERGEWERTAAQHRRNFQLFDAPVGIFLSMHRTMRSGGWLDLGLYLEAVMTMARAHGLHTCPQAAWLEFKALTEEVLGIPDEEDLVVGCALGWEDESAVVNRLRTERADVGEFVRFLD
jgi:nitroreductase